MDKIEKESERSFQLVASYILRRRIKQAFITERAQPLDRGKEVVSDTRRPGCESSQRQFSTWTEAKGLFLTPEDPGLNPAKGNLVPRQRQRGCF